MRSLLALVSCLVLVGAALALSGCVTTDRGDGNGNGDGGTNEPTFSSEDKFGLHWEAVTLHASITPGVAQTWKLKAINGGAAGENSFDYKDGCGNPWTISLTGPGGDVRWKENDISCDGFSNKELLGGESKLFEWVWDGRIYDDSGATNAPSGTYTLTVGMQAAHAGVHNVEPRASTTFATT